LFDAAITCTISVSIVRKVDKIYYLDETWLNASDRVDHVRKDNTVLSKHDAFNKGLTTGSTNPTDKGKRLIILHIGSDKGFLQGGLLCFESKKKCRLSRRDEWG